MRKVTQFFSVWFRASILSALTTLIILIIMGVCSNILAAIFVLMYGSSLCLFAALIIGLPLASVLTNDYFLQYIPAQELEKWLWFGFPALPLINNLLSRTIDISAGLLLILNFIAIGILFGIIYAQRISD